MDAAAPFIDTAGSTTARAATAARAAGPEKVRQAAQDFEAVLVGQLMGLMLESVPSDGPFGGGHAEGIYRSMLAEQMGREITKRGGLGLSTSLMNEIIRMQQAPEGAGHD